VCHLADAPQPGSRNAGKISNRSLHLVRPTSGNPEQQVFLKRKTFETGQVVPQSGIYSVTHAEHRLPHEVTLLRADTFPPCAKCGVQVRFALLRGVSPDSFKVVLNSLPEVAAIGEAEDFENAG